LSDLTPIPTPGNAPVPSLQSAAAPVAEPDPARLRIYLGAAPGVGKTYSMLEHAHQLQAQGVDVVIGFIEAHQRHDTLALVEGLPAIPLKKTQYRTVTLEEMDLEGILARKPNTVLVDELAHTNVPGSRNRKRYEDVLELLDAGINVETAMNVQHLETLNDAVARSAKTTIRETVPDSFLRRADEVVNVDVSIDELRDRLRAGKIYKPERVEQALANFFRKGNLTMLRELALRTTAEQVGAAASEYRRAQGLEQAPMPERVMVCLSHRPGTERLIRVAARIAGRLATSWYAVYVQGARDHRPDAGDPGAAKRLEEYRQLAESLGAQAITLEDKQVGEALIAFAKKESISHVIFGQAPRSRLDLLLRGSVINDFLNQMPDTTVQVVPMTKYRREERG
jgi:two-component system sensor histidine kinase KdpD